MLNMSNPLTCCTESFVHVLGSMPDTRLRLDVLRLHHYFEEDLPKKVSAWAGIACFEEDLPKKVSAWAGIGCTMKPR